MPPNPFGPKGFTADQIPDQHGRTIAITGANSGVGLEAARHLGRKGAHILMLCRSPVKADEAQASLRDDAPDGAFTVIPLDLASLESVRAAAARVREETGRLDALVNNAGVMWPPERRLTEDGFELQVGVNFLGHFALSALLGGPVMAAGGRFVWLGSMAHHFARAIPFDDFSFEKKYNAQKAYAVSKLACIMIAKELQRRLAAAGNTAISLACHPGYAATNLQYGYASEPAKVVIKPVNALFAQSAEKGALPLALAAAAPHAHPGGYYGPTGFLGLSGPVGPAKPAAAAENTAAARRLWDTAEALTGEKFVLAPASAG